MKIEITIFSKNCLYSKNYFEKKRCQTSSIFGWFHLFLSLKNENYFGKKLPNKLKITFKKKKLFMAKVQWGYLGWNNSNWAQSKL